MAEIKVLGRSCWGHAAWVEEVWKSPVEAAPQSSNSIRALRLVRRREGVRTGMLVIRGGDWRWYRVEAKAIDRLDRNAQHESVGLRLVRKEATSG